MQVYMANLPLFPSGSKAPLSHWNFHSLNALSVHKFLKSNLTFCSVCVLSPIRSLVYWMAPGQMEKKMSLDSQFLPVSPSERLPFILPAQSCYKACFWWFPQYLRDFDLAHFSRIQSAMLLETTCFSIFTF
jgi:hypothetical protein